MHLPVELIDEILSHLPPHGEESLYNYSLVARSWLDPCQRRIFESVTISPDTQQSWLDNISPTNTELLRHVRELVYVDRARRGLPHPPCRIGDDLQDYLPSFLQLQSLTFGLVDIQPVISDNVKLFFAFQYSLSSLFLFQVSATWNGFVTLLAYFPNIRSLDVNGVLFEVDDSPAPQIPHALRGRLFIRCARERDPKALIDRFAGLRLEYEKLVIIGDYDQRLVAAVEENLKYLRIARCILNLTLDLSRCQELRQLDITLLQPQERERALISSITSTNLRKLTFTSWISDLEWDFLLYNPCWTPFDDAICELVDRLQMSGYKHTLEVVFRAEFVDLDEEVDHDKFLPKFKEKGRIRIVEISSGDFREWP